MVDMWFFVFLNDKIRLPFQGSENLSSVTQGCATAECLQFTTSSLGLRLRLLSAATMDGTPTKTPQADPRSYPSAWFALPRLEEVTNDLFKP